MRTLTLKNVPDDLYDALRHCAEKNRRSLNQEAIVRLADAVSRTEDGDLLERIDRHRNELKQKGFHATSDEIRAWIHEGRA